MDQDINNLSPNEVFEIFKITFSESNDQSRKEAEAKLKSFEQNLLGLLKFVSNILPNPELTCKSTKLSICTFLKNVIKRRIEKKENLEKDLTEILRILVPLSINNSMQESNTPIQEQINQIISIILSKPEIQNGEAIPQLLDFVDSLLDKTNIPSLSSSFLIFQLIIASPIKVINVQNYFSKARQIIHSLNEVTNEYLSQFKALSSSTDIELFIKLLSMKRVFYEAIFLITLKLKKAELLLASVNEELVSLYLDDAINTILFQSDEFSFISFSGNNQIDSAINNMKCKAFMWISIIIQNEGNEIKNKSIVEKCLRLFFSVGNGFKNVLNSKYDYISMMSRGDQKFPDNDYSTIIFQANLFISRLLVREPIVNKMNKHIKE